MSKITAIEQAGPKLRPFNCNKEFLKCGLWTFGTRQVLVWGSYSAHHRVFNGLPQQQPLPLIAVTRNVSTHGQIVMG